MIEIVDIGLLASIQGKAYRGSRHLGMPLSGAADPLTMGIANTLAGNAYDCASIEFSILGGAIKAHHDMHVGITGPIKQVSINGNDYDHHKSISLTAGDILMIEALPAGANIYMAVHGGLEADQHWNGNSTFTPAKIGGHRGRALQKGDVLKVNTGIKTDINKLYLMHTLPEKYRMQYGHHHIIRICPYTDALGQQLCDAPWNVGRQGNRIGYALDGDQNIISPPHMSKSVAVFTGHIQCPPSGAPFLLGPDAQTTGGYPLIGHVIRADRHIIGQIKSSDKISFIANKPHEARRVYQQKLKMWRDYIPDLHLD